MSDSAPVMPIAGRFTPVSLLGRGGMGEVWLSRDRVHQTEVALKRVSPIDSDGPVGIRHQREFMNLCRLRHPGILRVEEYGIDGREGARWFTSEVLRGPVSGEICPRISFPRWFELCSGMLEALAFMHRNGWVHGDIKSDNIRLRSRPVDQLPLDPVLLDFGLSHREGHPGEEKILGTPHSMPPEQWLGEPPDARGDVYSAGILFYQLWCGRMPFRGPQRSRLGRAHLQEDPPDLDQIRPGLPPRALQCIGRMLAKRPDDRPRDGGELWNRFQQVGAAPVDPASSVQSLAAQIRYAGPSDEQIASLLDALRSAVAEDGDPGIVLHLHRRCGDRRRIAERVRTHLLGDGIPVISVDPASSEVLADLSDVVADGTELVVAMIEDPGTGSVALRSALENRHVRGCRVLWWINCDRQPAGYLGSVVANRPTRRVSSDEHQAVELGQWLEEALPAARVPGKLMQRLQRWGQGSPAIWQRILLGRVKAGQLSHDGLRWSWNRLDQYPEDRWRIRATEQARELPDEELRILQALSILRAPAVPSDVARVAGIGPGQFPALASKLVQRRWIRIDSDLHWCEPFQAEGVLLATAADLRQQLHEVASGLKNLDELQRARHRISAGDPRSAAESLKVWLKDRVVTATEATGLIEVLTPLVDHLPAQEKSDWAELLGRVEDSLDQSARRDQAWRICAASLQGDDGSASIRLARLRAHTTRRDGDPLEALRILEKRMPTDPQAARTQPEWILMALEHSRVLRTLARRGLAAVPSFEVPEQTSGFELEITLESCRCALARGARLHAKDLASQVIDQATAGSQARFIAEAQCLLARAVDDSRSLRVWSRLHELLCRRQGQGEAAVVARIESAEAGWRLGLEAEARSEISSVIEEVRRSYRGQLPRALLLLARCEAGAGWTRSAALQLEEALTLDGPAGIVAWEGNLLVAASEWAAGRCQIALEILQSTLPERAPHEQQSIDIHWRHAILESRCVFSSGEPLEALKIIDQAIGRLRTRGTARDVGPLRRERVQLLDRLGHTVLAQSERRRITADFGQEPGADPEPAGLRRAREALERRRHLLLHRGSQHKADRYLETAALKVLRLRAQPLTTWLSLERSEDLNPSEREQAASSAWRKVVRLESREGRAAVLLWWAQSRERNGDPLSGSRLRKAALREVDRWQQKSPEGTRWKELAKMLRVEGLGSEALSGNGGRNAALA